MKRTFLSLYLVVAVSVLAFSWATEKLWQSQFGRSENNEISLDQRRYIELLEQLALGDSIEEIEASLAKVLSREDVQFQILDVDDLAQSNLKGQILSGNIVPLSKSQNTLVFYKRITDSPYVLSITELNAEEEAGYLYLVFGVGFYLMIAVAVYFWVWPLSRDLKKLNKSTKTLVNSDDEGDIQLNKRSAVYDLASSFNAMKSRIRSLVASQKEMTHAMSHELRTPLARMKFTVASLESRLGESDENICQIQQDIHEMDKLIADFLNYASFEERQKNLQFECGQLAPMIDRIAQGLEIHNVEIIDKLNGEDVWCEWYLMEHCVRILLENAKKFCLQEVRVTLRQSEKSYVIEVEDDGPGVAAEDRESIFKAFYRSDNRSNESKGFGLGLALVLRMMRWHNGDVQCHSSSLGGAKFRIAWTYDKDFSPDTTNWSELS